VFSVVVYVVTYTLHFWIRGNWSPVAMSIVVHVVVVIRFSIP